VSAAGATATGAHACTVTVWLTFTPALTKIDQAVTVTDTFTDTCGQVSTDGSTGVTVSTTGSGSASYDGSCISAHIFTSTSEGELVGGTVMELTGPAQIYVLKTLSPCDDPGPTPASGVSAGPT
jgi:hypothetical protein